MQTGSKPLSFSFSCSRSHTTHNMKLFIIFAISVLNLHLSSQFYNIQELNYGFYFETMDKIQIQTSTWTFISHINLTLYTEEIEEATKLTQEAKRQCEILNNQIDIAELCNDIVLELDHELDEIKRNNHYIITPNPTNTSNRKKRGLFNIVGQGLKFFFGTLDSSDATMYTEYIKKIDIIIK